MTFRLLLITGLIFTVTACTSNNSERQSASSSVSVTEVSTQAGTENWMNHLKPAEAFCQFATNDETVLLNLNVIHSGDPDQYFTIISYIEKKIALLRLSKNGVPEIYQDDIESLFLQYESLLTDLNDFFYKLETHNIEAENNETSIEKLIQEFNALKNQEVSTIDGASAWVAHSC